MALDEMELLEEMKRLRDAASNKSRERTRILNLVRAEVEHILVTRRIRRNTIDLVIDQLDRLEGEPFPSELKGRDVYVWLAFGDVAKAATLAGGGNASVKAARAWAHETGAPWPPDADAVRRYTGIRKAKEVDRG